RTRHGVAEPSSFRSITVIWNVGFVCTTARGPPQSQHDRLDHRRGQEAGNESAYHGVDKSDSWQARELERNSNQGCAVGDLRGGWMQLMRFAVRNKIALEVAGLAVLMVTTAVPAAPQDVP